MPNGYGGPHESQLHEDLYEAQMKNDKLERQVEALKEIVRESGKLFEQVGLYFCGDLSTDELRSYVMNVVPVLESRAKAYTKEFKENQ